MARAESLRTTIGADLVTLVTLAISSFLFTLRFELINVLTEDNEDKDCTLEDVDNVVKIKELLLELCATYGLRDMLSELEFLD